jgi:hypothetical protein
MGTGDVAPVLIVDMEAFTVATVVVYVIRVSFFRLLLEPTPGHIGALLPSHLEWQG